MSVDWGLWTHHSITNVVLWLLINLSYGKFWQFPFDTEYEIGYQQVSAVTKIIVQITILIMNTPKTASHKYHYIYAIPTFLTLMKSINLAYEKFFHVI